MRNAMIIYGIILSAILIFSCGGNDGAGDDDDIDADDSAAGDDSGDDSSTDDDVQDDNADDDSTDDSVDDDTGDCVPLYPDVMVSAHRGAHLWAPENTIPAIEKAFDLGAVIVEMDVRETSDLAFVLMHDDTVDRTTNGHGLVSDFTLDEIKQLVVKDWMYFDHYPDLRVPTFAEALDSVAAHGGQVYLDMKTDEVEGAIQAVIDKGLENIVFVYSSNWSKLDRVRTVAPTIRIQPPTSSVAETQAILDHFDPDPQHIELSSGGFTPANVALIQSAGATISMDSLGVRDVLAALGFREAWRQMMEGGLDIISTDLPGALVTYRDSLCE